MTGELLWEQSYSSGYDEHAAFPLYDEPYLRTMQPFRAGSDLYMLEAAPRKNGTPDKSQYRLKPLRHDSQMSNDVASSVLVNGCVYGFDVQGRQTSPHRPTRGMFRCMDFTTGKTLWSSDRPGQASIAVADGKLLLFNDRGEVLLVRANPQCYEELARTEVFRGEICWTAPSLHRGRLFVRSPTRSGVPVRGDAGRFGQSPAGGGDPGLGDPQGPLAGFELARGSGARASP